MPLAYPIFEGLIGSDLSDETILFRMLLLNVFHGLDAAVFSFVADGAEELFVVQLPVQMDLQIPAVGHLVLVAHGAAEKPVRGRRSERAVDGVIRHQRFFGSGLITDAGWHIGIRNLYLTFFQEDASNVAQPGLTFVPQRPKV